MALILATTYPESSPLPECIGNRLPIGHPGPPGAGRDGRPQRPPSHGGIGAEMAPVVLIHGTDDRVVRPPNADRIVDQWLASRDAGRPQGLNQVRPLATTRAFVVDHRRCIRTRWYTARGRRVLEYWRIDGLGHAWSGGRLRGAYIDRKGPKTADVMWTFFARHRLPAGAAETAEVDDQDLAWDIRLG